MTRTLLALSLLAGTPAVAADADNPANPFREPLSFPREPKVNFLIADEDLANPLSVAHSSEHSVYQNLYYAYYNGHVYNTKAALPAKLPSPVDAQGAPLWFDGPSGDQSIRSLITRLYSLGRYDDIDRMFEDFHNASQRTADGRWKLSLFHKYLGEVISNTQNWEAILKAIRGWQEKSPASRAAILAEIMYWKAYAFNARGSGSNRSITPEGKKLFEDRINKAEALLIASQKQMAATTPLWARIYFEITPYLKKPKLDANAIFAATQGQHRYYNSLHALVASMLSPAWGGKWKAADKFILASVKAAEDKEGPSFYARLYWTVMQNQPDEINLFKATPAKWPLMKRSFEDMVQKTPHSAFNMSNFAAAACMANDKQTYLDLRKRLGKYAEANSFQSNYSMDLCDSKFAAAK